MKPKRQRGVLRAVHIGLSFVMGFYVYAPLEELGDVRLIVQAVVFPALAVTGMWMWQQRRVNRWLRRGKRAEPPEPASLANG